MITGANPPADRMHALEGRAEWHHTDTERPTAEGVLAALGERGADVVLAEGGRPSTASSSTAASSTNSAFRSHPTWWAEVRAAWSTGAKPRSLPICGWIACSNTTTPCSPDTSGRDRKAQSSQWSGTTSCCPG